MKKSLSVVSLFTAIILTTGCSTIQGTVYKQTDGSYKATYAASSEKDVRSVIHSDAIITCENKAETEDFIVVKEEIEKTEDNGQQEGFSAVAGSAVSLVGKFYGVESVRGSLVFNCDPS